MSARRGRRTPFLGAVVWTLLLLLSSVALSSVLARADSIADVEEEEDAEGHGHSSQQAVNGGAAADEVTARVVQRAEALLAPLEHAACVESGGSGWWRYAWCHLREVRQFHAEPRSGARSVDWSAGSLVIPSATEVSASNPSSSPGASSGISLSPLSPGSSESSRPPSGGFLGGFKNGRPSYLAYRFEDGQPCENVGQRRSTIVRIRCCGKFAGHAKRSGSLALHLAPKDLATVLAVSEVATCSYAMSVCSPIGCLLQKFWDEEAQECVQNDPKGIENEDGYDNDGDDDDDDIEVGTRPPIARQKKRKSRQDAWTIRRDSTEGDAEHAAPAANPAGGTASGAGIGSSHSSQPGTTSAGDVDDDDDEDDDDEDTNDIQRDMSKRSSTIRLSPAERVNLREQVRGMFYHGYDSYMENAFPLDELKPLSCGGANFGLTAGDMLSLVDSLDMLVVLGNYSEFARAVRLVAQRADFNLDETVSVFETTIRVLGGLLTAHLWAIDEDLKIMPDYDGSLLKLAKDLGDRLMPAFNTTTSIPYGTVNLRHGVPKGETTEACTAAAGSLSLEFGLLSVLTDEPRYGVAAREALKAIYDHRSKLDLVGRHIDIQTGRWTEPIAGIGSNIDSLYEYYIKQYIAFGDEEAFAMFQKLYTGAVRHLRVDDTWYVEVNMHRGNVQRRQFNNLQAFWPGMQTLTGDMQAASQTINAFMRVWNEFGFTPEDFGIDKYEPLSGGSRRGYPLRPELAESVFYMSTTTQDPAWLVAGRDMVRALEQACRVECGYASIKDIKTERLHDNMPSFFLSELLKYLYLLFDEDNFLREDRGGNYVFTTEAHAFPVRADFHRKAREMGFSFPRKGRKSSSRDSLKDQKKDILWGVPSITDESLYEEWMCPAFELDASLKASPSSNARTSVASYYGANVHLRRPRRFGYLSKSAASKHRSRSEGQDASGTSRDGEGSYGHDSYLSRGHAPDDDDEAIGEAEDFMNSVQTIRLGPGEDSVFEVQPLEAGFHVYHEATNAAVTISNLATDVVAVEVIDGHATHSKYIHVNKRTPGFGLHCSVEVQFGTEDSNMVCLEQKSLANILGLAKFSRWNMGSGSELPIACSFSEFGPGPVAQLVEGSVVLAAEAQGCSARAYPRERVANRIVLVRRGDCMFEQKALLAQQAGALALLIAQNKDEEGLFYMVSMTQNDLLGKAMAAFFPPAQSSLPTFMISKREGDILYHRIRQQRLQKQKQKQKQKQQNQAVNGDNVAVLPDSSSSTGTSSGSPDATHASYMDEVHLRIETQQTRQETLGFPWILSTGVEIMGMVLPTWGFSVKETSLGTWAISLINTQLQE